MAQFEDICEILKTMDKSQLNRAKKILQLIASDNVIKIHIANSGDAYSSNISPKCLQITKNEPKLNPTANVPKDLPYYMPLTYIADEYYLKNCEHIDNLPPNYVLKTTNDVLINNGDKVVYNKLIFYARYLGTVIKMYATKNDYDMNRKSICVNAKLLYKLVHVDDLENEMKKCNEMHTIWHGSRDDLLNHSYPPTDSESD